MNHTIGGKSIILRLELQTELLHFGQLITVITENGALDTFVKRSFMLRYKPESPAEYRANSRRLTDLLKVTSR